MSRTVRGEKGPGFGYSGKRYGNGSCCNCPSPKLRSGHPRDTKTMTRRAERRISRQEFERRCL